MALAADRSFTVFQVDHEHWSTAIAHSVSSKRRSKPPCLITLTGALLSPPLRAAAIPPTNPSGPDTAPPRRGGRLGLGLRWPRSPAENMRFMLYPHARQ